MPRLVHIRKDFLKMCSDKHISEKLVDNRSMRPLVRLGLVSMKMNKAGERTYRITAKGRKALATKEEE